MTGNIIPDRKLSKALNVLYNVWFNKWKHKTGNMTDKDWDECIKELVFVTEQGDYTVVLKIGIALLDELDARTKGEYKELDWLRKDK